MTPNLFLATQTLLSPHKWFKGGARSPRQARTIEHWDSPVPGVYEYIPGRGWYLVATHKTSEIDNNGKNPSVEAKETIIMTQPIQVKYSKVLKKYLLAPDYDMRKRHAKIQGSKGKLEQVGFFRLDDGVAWVQCWDAHGEFIPGPYKLWCIDKGSNNFRHMLKSDDPEYVQSRRNSPERNNSHDRNTLDRSHSQDSRSTQYRSGPENNRDGPSVPSTRTNSRVNSRTNSIKGLTSTPASKLNSRVNSPHVSRPGSPRASPSIALSEATTLLDPIAAMQATAGPSNSASVISESETDKAETVAPESKD